MYVFPCEVTCVGWVGGWDQIWTDSGCHRRLYRWTSDLTPEKHCNLPWNYVICAVYKFITITIVIIPGRSIFICLAKTTICPRRGIFFTMNRPISTVLAVECSLECFLLINFTVSKSCVFLLSPAYCYRENSPGQQAAAIFIWNLIFHASD